MLLEVTWPEMQRAVEACVWALGFGSVREVGRASARPLTTDEVFQQSWEVVVACAARVGREI